MVDGVMFALRSMVARGRHSSLVTRVHRAGSAAEAHALIAAGMAPVTDDLSQKDLDHIYKRIIARPCPTEPLRLSRQKILGALGVFLLVVTSTFPVIIPFLLVADLYEAKRCANAVAIGMLCSCGYSWGRYAGMRPMMVGAVMVLLGSAITVTIIALGG